MQIIDHCTEEGGIDMLFRSSSYGAAVLWRSSAMAMEPAGPCGKKPGLRFTAEIVRRDSGPR